MQQLLATLLVLVPHVLGKPTMLPTRRSSACCSEASFNWFHWIVDSFDFHASYIFSTPAHQNSWGYINFNLSNPALPDVRASCSAQSDQISDFFYGTFWYNCTFNGTAGPAPATFTFNRPTGELDINQTWTCDDEDPDNPTTFRGYGTTTLNLDCNTTLYQNPNWTIGEIYSDEEIKCTPATVVVKPYKMTAVA